MFIDKGLLLLLSMNSISYLIWLMLGFLRISEWLIVYDLLEFLVVGFADCLGRWNIERCSVQMSEKEIGR